MDTFGGGLAAMVELATRSGRDENAVISLELMPDGVRVHVQRVMDEAFRHSYCDQPYDEFSLSRLESCIHRALRRLRN